MNHYTKFYCYQLLETYVGWPLTIRRAWIKWSSFFLWDFLYETIHLRGGSLIEFDVVLESRRSDRV